MADVGIGRTGMPDVPVARLTRMTQSAGRGAMESLIDGKTAKILAMPTMKETETEMAASPRGRTVSRAARNSKEAGSAMRPPPMALKLKTRNQYVPENGAGTDTARTVTGPAAPNSTKSQNGWIAMIEMSHDAHTRRRISSAGRSA